MKLITSLLLSMPFLFLLDGSCAQNKVLKQELTSSEFKLLKASPDCLKDKLINHYNEEGNMDGIDVIRSTVEGKTAYFLGGAGMYEIMDDSCSDISSMISSSEDFEDVQTVLGDADRVPPPPRKKGEPIILDPQTGPSKVGQPRPSPELNPRPVGKPKKIEGGDKLTAYDSQVIETANASDMSDCMKEKVEYFITDGRKLSLSSCYSYTSKGETFYMFDHGMAVDGPAYVLNESCDTVCVTGGFRRINSGEKPACPPEDDYNKRKEIWTQGKGRATE